MTTAVWIIIFAANEKNEMPKSNLIKEEKEAFELEKKSSSSSSEPEEEKEESALEPEK